MRFTIYYNKNDKFIEPLHRLAKKNKWTIGFTIRDILNEKFNNTEPVKEIQLGVFPFKDKPKRQKKIKKIDQAEFEAEMMSKLIPDNTNINVSNCDRRTIVDGVSSCYFFDNYKEYYPFCVKDCWGNKDIWKDKARKLKLIKEGE